MLIGRAIIGSLFKNLNEAETSLNEAGETLNAIDVSSIEDERLARGIERMKLDRLKYVAELAHSRANETTVAYVRNQFLQNAIETWSNRANLGREYYTKTGDWKGREVEWSSNLGLGNMHVAS